MTGHARELLARGIDLNGPALAWLGVLAVLAGAAIGVALADPGVARRSAALAGAASILWMAIRWLAMRLSAPAIAAEEPALLRSALALGLLGYAFAVTPGLRLVAWVAAMLATGWTLQRFGRERREVVRAVAWAWGVQALIVACGWLARNAFVAVVATRG